MKVSIREREYEYESDYKSDHPNGWKHASGDPYKFPVIIGPHKCFVKRFQPKITGKIPDWALLEVKSKDRYEPNLPRFNEIFAAIVEKIPGWDLLVKLKNKFAPNLPRLHDVVAVKEESNLAYYVFFELSEGRTLHEVNNDSDKVDLNRLNNDLFSAILSIQAYKHWLPDFCEKNILLDKNGKFLLIDLDSALPLSKLPERNIDYCEDYWILVIKFYNDILHITSIEHSDLNGISFNCLHAIFLILRLKEFYAGHVEQYNKLYDDLPKILFDLDPQFTELFKQAIKDPQESFTSADILKIRDLVREKIINVDRADKPIEPEKLIHNFSVANYIEEKDERFIVYSKKSFTLNWDVDIKCSLELYRNGVFNRKLESGKKNTEITEIVDGKEKIVVYSLDAKYGDMPGETKTITILVTSEPSPLKADPVILQFTVNRKAIKHQESFKLEWKVENASNLILYRQDREFKKFSIQETGIQLFEKAAEYKNEVVFRLEALNESGKSDSKTLTLVISPPAIRVKLPVINEFTSNKNTVRPKEPFMLQWKVKNASKITLYRNNLEFKEIQIQETNIELFELYDKNKNNPTFKLVAANESGKEVESEEIQILVEPVNPAILEFAADKYNVKHTENFLLHWKVENAKRITLYRNGKEFKKLSTGETSIKLFELYDKKNNSVEFVLIAGNEAGQKVESAPVKIIIAPSVPSPVIYAFASDKTSVKDRENFVLTWHVENATEIILYRNETKYNGITIQTKSKKLSERYDEKNNKITFRLLALNESGQQDQSLTIKVLPSSSRWPWLTPLVKKIIYTGVAVITLMIIFFLIAKKIDGPSPIPIPDDTVTGNHIEPATPIVDTAISFDSLKLNTFKAGDILTISGRNFPTERDSISIYFNKFKGAIKIIEPRIIRVRVPVVNKNKDVRVNVVAVVHQRSFLIGKSITLKNPLDTSTPDNTLNTNVEFINLNESNGIVDFSFKPEGQAIYIKVVNKSNWRLNDVNVKVTCDSVFGGSEIAIKDEDIRFGACLAGATEKRTTSGAFYKVYDRARQTKKLRLQLSCYVDKTEVPVHK